MDYEFDKDAQGKPFIKVSLSDYNLISNPLLNKGMAFTYQERETFGLLGLIPPHEATLETQCKRSYKAFLSKPSDIEKYIYLRDLQDSNETLYYRLITEHIDEMLPIVYTPTVGLGCEYFSYIYRRPRGIFISYPYINQIDKILSKSRFDLVKVIVVSDGERILGLGDQGAGGMAIPIGKLALYTACAGIHPAETLPILLDVGTNNQDRLKDFLYIGWQHERVRGQDYNDFIEAFVIAIQKRFPHVLLQWEDFAQQNANPILERYRQRLCTFNDDIQGTAAVAAGTLFAAIEVTGTKLLDQRIVVVGAGSAGCGISRLILQAMMEKGKSEKEASEHFYLVDRFGLLIEGMPGILPFQKTFVQKKDKISAWKVKDFSFISLEDVVNNIHPTLLIGVSGQANIFTEKLVREMAAHVKRPIIFPLSNPTNLAEATPNDLLKWTEDRAIIGTGSPFANVKRNGYSCRIDQTNNAYIFPGIGLGLIAVKAKYATDNMFMLAAKALADCSPAKQNKRANLLPGLADIRTISLKVASAVAREAIAKGLAGKHIEEPIEKHISAQMWVPDYLPYKKA